MTVTDNANVIFADTFLSLTDAVNFFTDDVLTLGTIFGASNDIGVDLALVSSDNVGFQGDFIVGTVPEPASWLLFGTGLVLLGVYGRRAPLVGEGRVTAVQRLGVRGFFAIIAATSP